MHAASALSRAIAAVAPTTETVAAAWAGRVAMRLAVATVAKTAPPMMIFRFLRLPDWCVVIRQSPLCVGELRITPIKIGARPAEVRVTVL
jgi:hypothetical protein